MQFSPEVFKGVTKFLSDDLIRISEETKFLDEKNRLAFQDLSKKLNAELTAICLLMSVMAV